MLGDGLWSAAKVLYLRVSTWVGYLFGVGSSFSWHGTDQIVVLYYLDPSAGRVEQVWRYVGGTVNTS